MFASLFMTSRMVSMMLLESSSILDSNFLLSIVKNIRNSFEKWRLFIFLVSFEHTVNIF